MSDANQTRDDATDRGQQTHRIHYDPEGDAAPSEALVFALADLTDADPLALESLYETVDPDTVDDFVASGALPDVGGHVQFTHEGYDVRIHASGLMELTPGD